MGTFGYRLTGKSARAGPPCPPEPSLFRGSMSRRRIVILGGGYGGLAALRRLSRRLDPARYVLTLVDAAEHHAVKTRFHEIAVSKSRELFVRFSLPALTRASRAEFVCAAVRRVDWGAARVATDAGDLAYDGLIVALGGQTHYFGVDGARENAVALQSYEAVAEGNRRMRFLGIGRAGAPPRRIVVCGAGIEGLEVAAMVRHEASAERCAVTVVERAESVMARSQCGDAQRRYVGRYFERRGVVLRLGAAIRAIEPGRVHLENGEDLPADLVYWCSGVRRVDLDGLDADAPFAVDEFLRVSGHPEAFGAGDFVTVETDRPWANLGSAQRALYQGELAAENLVRAERGEALHPADYRPKGEIIALGDLDAVGIVEGVPVQGIVAAALKKGIEAHYLTELLHDVPAHLARTASL